MGRDLHCLYEVLGSRLWYTVGVREHQNINCPFLLRIPVRDAVPLKRNSGSKNDSFLFYTIKNYFFKAALYAHLFFQVSEFNSHGEIKLMWYTNSTASVPTTFVSWQNFNRDILKWKDFCNACEKTPHLPLLLQSTHKALRFHFKYLETSCLSK